MLLNFSISNALQKIYQFTFISIFFREYISGDNLFIKESKRLFMIYVSILLTRTYAEIQYFFVLNIVVFSSCITNNIFVGIVNFLQKIP